MNKFFKILAIIISVCLLFSSCAIKSADKSLTKIEEYLQNNQFNECYQYITSLNTEEKTIINDDALLLISSKYNELVTSHKIDNTNIYVLNNIEQAFAENCRKLWNIAKYFSIEKESNLYNDFVHIYYYAEICNYTKYSEIYHLLSKVHTSGYLDEITNAIKDYNDIGDNSKFESAYKKAFSFKYDEFNPQEFLVEDYRKAHDSVIKSLNSLLNGFATNDINIVASSISELEDSLTEILYIIDIVNTVHTKQIYIFNELSTNSLNLKFDSAVEIDKREFSSGTSLPLDNIFGIINNNENDDTNENISTENIKISVDEVLKIATKSINKTKKYKNTLNVSFVQTKNIQMTKFNDDSDIADAVDLTKATINQALKESNGTTTQELTFVNQKCGKLTLNSFIPPSNKQATINTESIKDYNIVGGSGGYVISLSLMPEVSSKYSPATGINSIINGFSFETSDQINNKKTTYSSASIQLNINNNGLLEKMKYSISGTSECEFIDENNSSIFEAQFTFNESYSYSFKY